MGLKDDIEAFRTGPWKAGDPKSQNRELHDNLQAWSSAAATLESEHRKQVEWSAVLGRELLAATGKEYKVGIDSGTEGQIPRIP